MAKTQELRAKVLADGTLMLSGVIGDEWDGLTSAQVVSAIRDLGEVDDLNVLINSSGGIVTEGLGIYHELATHPAKVVVEISGVAASMASAIAMAGDVVKIAKNGHIMIHDPWNVAVGNAEDLREAADLLDRFGTSLVNIYANKTGLPEDEIREMMAAETWLTADEALAKGFVDEVIEPVPAAAFADLDFGELASVPAALTRLIREGRDMARAKENPVQKPGPTPVAAEPAAQAGGAQAIDVAGAVAQALASERERSRAIREVATKAGLGESWAQARIDEGLQVEEVRAAALDALASRQDREGPSLIPGGVTIAADERDKWMAGMESWLVVKSGQARLIESHTGKRPDAGEFRGMSLLDIARDSLHSEGVSTRGMSPMDIAAAAIGRGPRAQAGLGTRSDFPVLLENVLHKMLLAAYETAPDQWRSVAATGSVQDFRDHPRLRLGSLPRLDALLESGEFRQMHFPDAEKEAIRAGTFGNIIGLTRQAIVNDDVDGFARLVTMLGRAAARSIEIDLFNLLTLNGGLGPIMGDGKTLFHADHGNIAATAGVPGIATLEEARVTMALQTDPEGHDFLNLRPAVWVGPIGLGSAVRTAIGAEYDFESETSGKGSQYRKPNVVRDLLNTVVDTPRLSGDRWYVFADPDIAPALEVAFLQGQESPVIETQEGFDYDGIRWRVRHDYGVGATDWRGAVTNAGAS